ncbi:MAG: M28 family peptidase [Gemmatimonadota bacterium]
MKIALSILLLAAPVELQSQGLPLKHQPQPTHPAIDSADLMTRDYILADDSMQGRGPGLVGATRATAYIASELARMKLVPGGDAGTFFQVLPLVENTVSDSTRLSAEGEALTLWSDVAPYALRVDASRLRPLDGIQVIYGGVAGDSSHMITAEQARGKLVVLTMPRRPDGSRQYLPMSFLLRLSQVSDAAGIAAVSLDVAPPQLLRAVQAPSMTMSTGDTTTLLTPLLMTTDGAQKFFSQPLDSLPVGAAGRQVRGNVIVVSRSLGARNVIGLLPGSDPALKAQVVAMGAHSDHVGMLDHPIDHDSVRAYNFELERRGQRGPIRGYGSASVPDLKVNVDSLRAIRPARPDSIFNGADDDGSGSSSLLEIAEAFASSRERPRRTLLFIWHTGEEMGLDGSAWHSTHTAVPRDSNVAYLNMDMVGRGMASDITGGGPRYLQLIGPRRLSTELGDRIEEVNRGWKVPMLLDYSFDADGHPYNRYCRSDHAMYARFGIPVTQFSAGYHVDYHQVTDEPQYLNYPHMALIAQFIHDVAARVANLDHRLVVDKPLPDPNAPCKQ